MITATFSGHGSPPCSAGLSCGQTGSGDATGEYGDLIAQGIIDPVKVTRSALRNAASIAALVLTTETLVVEKQEDNDEDDK